MKLTVKVILLISSFVLMAQGPKLWLLVGLIVAGTILYRNVTIRKRV